MFCHITGKMRLLTGMLLTLLFIPTVGSALSLTEALDRAAANNLKLQSSEQQADSAKYQADLQRANFLPTVDVSQTYVKTTSPMDAFGIRLSQEQVTQEDFLPANLNDPAETENITTSVTVRQPIFAGGQIYNGYRASTKGAEAAAARHESVRQQVTFNVI